MISVSGKNGEPAYVYMLRCAGNTLYTGWTNDPAARLYAHKSGKGGAKYTHSFRPEGFAYLEKLDGKSAAMKREAALKKLPKAEKEALCAAWAVCSRPRLALATEADAGEILALYSWYVRNSTATFQIVPPTLQEYEQWVWDTLAAAPLLTARDGEGRLLGYACAHRYHPREAFAWDAETTIYCAPEARGAGTAAALYGALLEALTLQGWWNAYGFLADPNPASEAFHRKFGFVCEGRSPRAGYKFGKWQGTSLWCRQLHKGRGRPQPVRPPLSAEELAPIFAKYETCPEPGNPVKKKGGKAGR